MHRDPVGPEGGDDVAAKLAQQLHSLRRVALAVAHPGGPELYGHLVGELAAALDVPMAFVATFADDARTRLRTLAAWRDGRPMREFEFPLEGSPCEQVVGRRYRYVPVGVAPELPEGSVFARNGMDSYAAFPLNDSTGAPLGLIAAMARAPIAGGDAKHAEAVLKVVAGRIAAEIERTRTDDVLRSAALAVSGARGDTVFDELVRLLATILHVEVAFIARHHRQDPGHLSVLAMYYDGQIVRDVRYGVAGTPCETVLGQQFRAYPRGVRQMFPEDQDALAQCTEGYAGYPLTALDGAPLGIVSVASRRPLPQVDRIEAMLKIFAVRAAAEVERLDANEALQRSEASYRAIFDAAEDSIFVHDWDSGAIVDVNPKACETYGYSRDELLRLGVAEISAGEPPYTAEDAARWLQLARLGRCPPFEWRRRNRDGSLHWDEVRLKPAVLSGRPHILAFTRDITGRKAAIAELQSREEQYRAIFDGSVDPMVLWNRHLEVVDVNTAFVRVTGMSRDDVVGRHWSGRPDAADMQRLVQHIESALAGRAVHLVERVSRADGSLFDMELRYLPVRIGDEPYALGVERDVTERLQLEAQLRQAQKMEAIGQLTGGIAHDFNNILTSVMGYLVMGEERAQAIGDTTLQRQLAQAHAASQRARDLVAQMLAFARRRGGERRTVALAPLVRQTLQLLRATLPTSVTLDDAGLDAASTQSLCVAADPVQLEQVLFNLCINARDAMDGAGRIEVRVRRHDGRRLHCASCRARIDGGHWVALGVADSGSGIPPELMERIFDPFFSTKAPGRGSGMGLAMVHGIVHDHGGHVVLRTQPGRGSEFGVMLPLATGEAAPCAAESPSRARGPALHGRVLLVEDDTMAGDYLHEQLGAWGLDVTLLRSPLQALAWLGDRAHEVDLLVTDHTMPQLTGLQLAERARVLRPALPVLLITGNAEAFDDDTLARHGVRRMLAKPLDPERLREALLELLPSGPGGGR